MKKLVLVESPTKSRTIQKFLGNEYIVEATFGHIRDLPKSKLSIDVEHDFQPKYVIPPKAKDVVIKLRKLAQDASEVILAPDEDREGEAIAWHLVQALDLDESTSKKKSKDAESKTDEVKVDASRIKRIVFHEITKAAIEEALAHPRAIDQNLVDAQQARRVLDRLVGYELSPFLWRKIRYGLSAGRVQSVAVRLVVEREREIQAFKSEEHWSIEAKLSKLPVTSPSTHSSPSTLSDDKTIFTAKLSKIDDKSVGKMDIKQEVDAKKIVSDLDGAHYTVQDIQKKEVKRNPSPPFTTSTLQQEAARKLGFSAKQTMVIAQQLYEHGHITYMRTDSLNLAASALAQAKTVIASEFGKNYTLDAPRYYANKSKGAQEAHEAIRPTDLSLLPQNFKTGADRGQGRLYDLIWKRTVASQMQHAIFDQTAVDILARASTSVIPASEPESRTKESGSRVPESSSGQAQARDDKNHNYIFRANGQVVKFDGFIRAYTEGKDDDNNDDDIKDKLPDLSIEEKLKLHELLPLQHFTEPPPRYTDATLIKALETHGIGRPSTYAPTLATIQERDYVSKEEKKYKPTEIGFLVNDMLVENFPEIVDINFTAKIEEDFDKIAEGTEAWVPVIREFYRPFKQHLMEKEASVEKQIEISTTPCSHCGKMMLIKFGRAGKFLACPDPESKITQPLPEEAAKIAELEQKTKGEVCPICGKPMGVKRGRFGYFLGCINYPKCKGISKIWNKTGFKCPSCFESNDRKDKPGDIVEKKSRGRRHSSFFACTRWPDCNVIINKLPESEEELQKLYKEWKANPPKPRVSKTYSRSKKSAKKKAA